MKRLFVTGAHGFVGGWVQRRAPEIAQEHAYQLAIPPVGFDLFDGAQVDAQLAQHRPDAILHLAAQSNVPHSFVDPERSFRTNVFGTLRLFEAIKRAGLRPRVVFASSGDVYGKVPVEDMPVTEKWIPRPCNPYAVSKLAAEALCYQWSQTEGLEVMVARPFNHVGAGQATSFVLPSVAQQVARIKAGAHPPFIEVGDIDVTRDFTHVIDVIEGYLTLLAKGVPGETYNIASGKDTLIRDLLERLLELANVKAEFRQDPLRFRYAEQRLVRGGNAKITSLGWRATHSIEEALQDVLQDWEQKTKEWLDRR